MKTITAFVLLFVFLTSCQMNTRQSSNQPPAPQNEANKEATTNEGKWNAGIDFYASAAPGNWTLQIGFNKELSFKTSQGLHLETPAAEIIRDTIRDHITYNAVEGSYELQIDIFGTACIDTLTETTFPYQVEIIVNNLIHNEIIKYQGCGSYTYNPKLNGSWQISRFGNEELLSSDFSKGLPRIQLNTKQSRVSGHDGCNDISGSFYLKKGRIIFGNIATTMMACPNQEVSRLLIQAITDPANTYSVTEDSLFFMQEDGQVAVKLKRIVAE